jgi:hypothetical protein
MIIKIAVISVLLILFACYIRELLMCKKEFLTSIPNTSLKKKYTEDVIKYKKLFTDTKGNYSEAKLYMPWIDAIIYEDIRMLSNQDKLNYENVIDLFE